MNSAIPPGDAGTLLRVSASQGMGRKKTRSCQVEPREKVVSTELNPLATVPKKLAECQGSSGTQESLQCEPEAGGTGRLGGR